MRRAECPSLCVVRACGRYARRGTTLIELLLVMAIVVVLMSLLLQSLKRTMELARSTVCKSHLREIHQGLYTYRVENDGWLPCDGKIEVVEDNQGFAPFNLEGEVAERTEGSSGVWFQNLVPAYIDEPLALVCPQDPYRSRMIEARFRVRDRDVADYASYGLNSLIVNACGGALADLDRNHPARPGDTILAADLGPDLEYKTVRIGRFLSAEDDTEDSTAAPRKGPYRFASLLSWDDGYDPYMPRRVDSWLTTRHGDGINVLTVGGDVRHARTVDVMRKRLRSYYSDCAAGGCTLCRRGLGDWRYHYSFAKDRLYWWTGAVPSE